MQRVIVNMQNFIFSDAIRRALREDGDFNVTAVDDTQQVVEQCMLLTANIVLMEVTGYTPWKLEERLKIRDELRRSVPDCKIVLIVDEKAEKNVAKQVKQAKQDGLIDFFVYGSTSSSYLTALLDTL
ncbi:hypothetical protein [Dysosmobacter sp.]